MSIISLSFVLFLVLTFCMYYLLPKRYQWVVLLAASIVFYLCAGVKSIVYILTTATTIYAATILMHRMAVARKQYLKENKNSLTKEEKTQYKNTVKKKRQLVMLCALLLNLGFLFVFKYFHFALEQLNSVIAAFGGAQIEDTFRLIVPLGISFYTFQAVGYLLDVYWENVEPEQNYLKVLLFVSFFPQVTQGPISDFQTLSGELFSEHEFSYRNYAWGFQRMVWGFFKKMLIANVLSPYVSNVFDHYTSYSGISTLIGAFMYSVQIYADFSGYMDIMCGYCEMLGIRLTENFDHPYFSKSIAEYWRRWHMSLGTWFKKYIYFPIGMSTWSRKLAKVCKQKFGKHFGDTFPATIALLVVWLATGVWHGASWAYIVWGLVNGLFIISSMWTEPLYAAVRKKLRINEKAPWWNVFLVIRTFILVTFIKVLPEVGTLSEGLGLWLNIFTNWTIPGGFSELLPFVDLSLTVYKINFLFAIFGTILMLAVSYIQLTNPVRVYFNRLPAFVRYIFLAVVLVLLASFGVQASWGTGEFLYAQF